MVGNDFASCLLADESSMSPVYVQYVSSFYGKNLDLHYTLICIKFVTYAFLLERGINLSRGRCLWG